MHIYLSERRWTNSTSTSSHRSTSVGSATYPRFVAHRENLIFLGPPGVGKTHLAVALGLEPLRSDIPSTSYGA
ncbi:ATP-binding protein [Paenibacillus sp. PR3]|uniref:ATP-binding protein n=1 Tax=Paenibacillus terricola TaxID=2763503 RepID=A0ABR8MY84_9BACL|nr:ATP-binding protein [Paenibacillus terricola]